MVHHLPAMDYNRPSVLGVKGFDLFEKLEHSNGSEGHPKVWPTGKMKLGDQSLRLFTRHVSNLEKK